MQDGDCDIPSRRCRFRRLNAGLVLETDLNVIGLHSRRMGWALRGLQTLGRADCSEAGGAGAREGRPGEAPCAEQVWIMIFSNATKLASSCFAVLRSLEDNVGGGGRCKSLSTGLRRTAAMAPQSLLKSRGEARAVGWMSHGQLMSLKAQRCPRSLCRRARTQQSMPSLICSVFVLSKGSDTAFGVRLLAKSFGILRRKPRCASRVR